jgi:hypothetical protein
MWKPVIGSDTSTERSNFTPHFATLDVVFSQWAGSSAPILVLTTQEERSGITPLFPTPLPTMSRANEAFLKLINWGRHLLEPQRLGRYRTVGRLPKSLIDELSFFGQEYIRWEDAYGPLLAYQESLPTTLWAEKASVLTLYSSYFLLKLELYHLFAGFDPLWMSTDVDGCYEKILSIAKTLHDGLMSSASTNARGRSYLFHGGVTGALSYTASSCLDMTKKRRALQMMKTWPIKEGSFDGKMAARGIEKAMALCTIPATLDREEIFDHATFMSIVWTMVAKEKDIHFNVVEPLRVLQPTPLGHDDGP